MTVQVLLTSFIDVLEEIVDSRHVIENSQAQIIHQDQSLLLYKNDAFLETVKHLSVLILSLREVLLFLQEFVQNAIRNIVKGRNKAERKGNGDSESCNGQVGGLSEVEGGRNQDGELQNVHGEEHDHLVAYGLDEIRQDVAV